MYHVIEKNNRAGVDVHSYAKTADGYRRVFETPQEAQAYGLGRVINAEIKGFIINEVEPSQ